MEKKNKDKDSMHRHCPEVEKLMEGPMPFVTRHGITLVALALLLIAAVLCLSGGKAGLMVKEMVEQMLPQVMRGME